MSVIGFKNLDVLGDMLSVPWNALLIAVLKWLLVRYESEKIIITSAFRPGDSGVHGQLPLRGFDLRSSVFDDPQKICDDINKHWTYDSSRPEMKVAIVHDVGQGLHFHIQVHPKTFYNQ